ncbi:MAG: putative lipid II flippase FtsW [Oscillospiraceae bacterium]|jgi:cell division protein FtsW|nr:putative lipid II flippase FtsW [Oscillospiraceae bacterium]
MAQSKEIKQTKYSKYMAQGGFDVPFLIIVLVLLTIGLVMLYSASYTYAYYNENGDSAHFFKRQLVFAVMGLAAMFVISKIKYDYFKALALVILPISFFLLVVVLFVAPPPGYEDFHRWITVPGLGTFQPSEVAKLALVLFMAWHIDKYYKDITSKRISQAKILQGVNSGSGRKVYKSTTLALLYFVLIGAMCVLVMMENHVSGTVLLFALGIMMIFLGGFNKKWFIAATIAVVIVVAIVIINPDILPGHASVRITSWLDKDFDPRGTRWQINQALYAIGSGGFFGVGLGNSKQKHLYVSEPQNDFIFSIVCEELGFIGAAVIIFLFALLVWRGFVIAMRAKDRFGALLAMGLVFQVGIQAALNIAVVTDTIPNTGISLPFFSYGGTSLLMLIVEMGMVLSISRYSRISKS